MDNTLTLTELRVLTTSGTISTFYKSQGEAITAWDRVSAASIQAMVLACRLENVPVDSAIEILNAGGKGLFRVVRLLGPALPLHRSQIITTGGKT